MTLLNKSLLVFLIICYIIFCSLKNNSLQIFLDNWIVQKKVLVSSDEPILVSDNSVDLFESILRNYSEKSDDCIFVEFERQEKVDFEGLKHLGAFFKAKTPPPEILSFG